MDSLGRLQQLREIGSDVAKALTAAEPKMSVAPPIIFLITTQAKRNLSSRSGIGGVLSAT